MVLRSDRFDDLFDVWQHVASGPCTCHVFIILYDDNLQCMIMFLYDVMVLYDVIWYVRRHGVSLWYDMSYLTRYMIWYDWQKVCWIGIMHNLDIHMKSCDRMKWYKRKR